MTDKKLSNKKMTALITGASSGIGYELAKLFARDGYDLVLVARGEARLMAFAAELEKQFGIFAKPMPLNLADPGAPKLLFDRLQSEGLSIDVLVNNAAYGKAGLFAEIPLADTLGQIDLNIRALSELTRFFLAPMVQRKSGKILNVASTAGFQPGPLMAVYYASKAYVISFSEAIANETKDSGITVTCLCPGPTDTGFQAVAGVENSRLFKTFGPMSARDVAQDGFRALMKGKTLTISGLRNRLVAETVRISPRKMATFISRWVVERAE